MCYSRIFFKGFVIRDFKVAGLVDLFEFDTVQVEWGQSFADCTWRWLVDESNLREIPVRRKWDVVFPVEVIVEDPVAIE